MAEKKNNRSIDKNNPQSVYRYLGFCPDDEEVSEWVKNIDISNIPQPDFSHSKHHIETVRSYAKAMAKRCELNQYWKNTIDQAAIYHDISQGLTTEHKVPIGPHNQASAVIAYMLTGNEDVAELVYSHDQDDLSDVDYKDNIRIASIILRDADQLALSGYSGLIRSAYYWGFRNELMFEDPQKILDEMILCDPRCSDEGLSADHERKVRLFVLQNLFPFLIKTGQIDRAVAHAKTNIERFFGSSKSEIGFLQNLIINSDQLKKILQEDSTNYNLRAYDSYDGRIQKTDKRYRNMFIRKPLIDCAIINTCESIQFRQQYYSSVEAESSIKELLSGQTHHTIPWDI